MKLVFQYCSKNKFIIHHHKKYGQWRTNQEKHDGLPLTIFDDISFFPKQNQNSNQRKN